MISSEELKDYWQPKLVRNLEEDERHGLKLIIGSLTELHIRQFDEHPGHDI